MSLSALALTGLEQALNRYLRLDPAAARRMQKLHGRVIAIELAGLEQTLYLVPGPAGIQVYNQFEEDADCTLRGTPLALARMGDSKKSSDRLFEGDVTISGDTELGHQFGRILGEMSIDWEARLADITGSMVAEDLAGVVRNLAQAGRRSLDTLELDLRELLQKETRLLPDANEVEQFLGEVDRLRDDVERLDARTRLLQQKLQRHNNKNNEETE